MKKILILLFAACIVFTSCSSRGNSSNLLDKVFSAKGYSAVADITITGNKGISKYKVKQYYLEPEKLRIETMEPDFLKGKIIIKYGQKWRVYHPLISQTIELSELKNDDLLILMGIVQKNVFTQKDSKVKDVNEKGKKYITIESPIPGGNKFRHAAVLYIDAVKKIPCYLNILDDNGNKTMEVVYSNFVYSKDFNDSTFILK